jgi:HK97 family phage prohead protease
MDRFRFDVVEMKFAGDQAGSFSGYGSIFGNIDAGGDLIEKGAFKRTLREWEDKGKYPPMLLQHGGGLFGGAASDGIPIGKWTSMEENSRGLKVEGFVDPLDTDEGKKIYAGLKNGGLDGLSIGYRTKQFVAGTKPGEPRRKITEVDLVELSIVTFPKNDKARVGAVKGIKTIREFEDFLRDVGGFSHAAAKAIAAGGFKATDPRDEDEADIAALIRRNIATLTRKD